MKAVVQRVAKCMVRVEEEEVGRIGAGLAVLLGVDREDTEADADFLSEKIAHLRVFEDEHGKMNRSLLDVGGEMMVISQFTLLGDCCKGRRPSFVHAAPPDKADKLYERFASRIRQMGVRTATGRFRAAMDVELINQGPVTLIVESKQ